MFESCVLLFFVVVCMFFNGIGSTTIQDQLENPAVLKFREYIKVDTSDSKNLPLAVEFWRRQADEFGLQFAVHEPAGLPICVLTWPGADPDLPSIMLNSHMDVVPAVDEDWKYPPFSAGVDADGNIYGRGAQDTKDVSIQYLAAIGRIKEENITLQRTIHITLMPDEETGGVKGMQAFMQTPEFAALNVGFALDEGLSAETDDMYATYNDRRPLFIKFTVGGNGGHGSTMPDNLAILKLKRLLDIMLEFRKPLADALKSKSMAELGEFTTLNINVINGGEAPNVVPEQFTLVADMRLSWEENSTEILSLVDSWVAYAGSNTTVEYLRQDLYTLPTPVDDTNPYWIAMKETINQLGYELHPIVCPAATDMLFLRRLHIPALGFSPKVRTTARLHAANEYLNVNVVLQGIDVYVALVKRLGNLPRN